MSDRSAGDAKSFIEGLVNFKEIIDKKEKDGEDTSSVVYEGEPIIDPETGDEEFFPDILDMSNIVQVAVLLSTGGPATRILATWAYDISSSRP